jgi:hypothetical protein
MGCHAYQARNETVSSGEEWLKRRVRSAPHSQQLQRFGAHDRQRASAGEIAWPKFVVRLIEPWSGRKSGLLQGRTKEQILPCTVRC